MKWAICGSKLSGKSTVGFILRDWGYHAIESSPAFVELFAVPEFVAALKAEIHPDITDVMSLIPLVKAPKYRNAEFFDLTWPWLRDRCLEHLAREDSPVKFVETGMFPYSESNRWRELADHILWVHRPDMGTEIDPQPGDVVVEWPGTDLTNLDVLGANLTAVAADLGVVIPESNPAPWLDGDTLFATVNTGRGVRHRYYASRV